MAMDVIPINVPREIDILDLFFSDLGFLEKD
jgi:hypothetical protein